MSIEKIHLMNYRNWADEHWKAGIELAPLTVVLGRNSAGKTSVLQPLRVLKQTIESPDPSIQLMLRSDTRDGVDCGSFREVVRDNETRSVLGIGLEVGPPKTEFAARFRLEGGRVVISALAYRAEGRSTVKLTLTDGRYWLSVPGQKASLRKLLAAQHTVPHAEFEPTRGIEFPEAALALLDADLGQAIRESVGLVRNTLKDLHYLGPLRPPPMREVVWLQQIPSRLGAMGTETVQALLGNERHEDPSKLKLAIGHWLKQMDLGDGIEVSRMGRGRLYQIDIQRDGRRTNLIDVGYGVSQVLPVIVLLHFVPPGSVLLIEDPEAHLHPAAQAALADMFVEVGKERNLQILIETHSEHMFRRLQFLMAAEKLAPSDCALYYVEREVPSATLTRLEVDEYGRVKNWPKDMFGNAAGHMRAQIVETARRMAMSEAAEEAPVK